MYGIFPSNNPSRKVGVLGLGLGSGWFWTDEQDRSLPKGVARLCLQSDKESSNSGKMNLGNQGDMFVVTHAPQAFLRKETLEVRFETPCPADGVRCEGYHGGP